MKKKPSPASRKLVSKPGPHVAATNSIDRDLWLHARSFHKAARKLAGALELDSAAMPDFDAGTVVFSMNRHALELHLKAIVFVEGSNFLATKSDPISVGKTHSLSWLAQFVSKIITAVNWKKEFKSEGVQNLADFKAVIEELSGSNLARVYFSLPSAP